MNSLKIAIPPIVQILMRYLLLSLFSFAIFSLTPIFPVLFYLCLGVSAPCRSFEKKILNFVNGMMRLLAVFFFLLFTFSSNQIIRFYQVMADPICKKTNTQ